MIVPHINRTMRQRLVQLIFDSEPDIAHRHRSEDLLSALAHFLLDSTGIPKYDIVQVEGLELAYIIPFIRSISPMTGVVFDAHNAETRLQKRAMNSDIYQLRRWPAALYSAIQIKRLRHYEAWACVASDWVTTVSESDYQQLKKMAPTVEMSVIPNCVDISEYDSISENASVNFDVVFTGKMDYRPNIDAATWFARRIWPQIRERMPQATFAIVGQQPTKRIEALKKISGITVTGRVKKVQPYLQGAKVFVMPFRIGSGSRLKLIEAMASGLPIVSTRVGAEGFPVEDDRHLLLADEPSNFAAVVADLLASREQRRRLGSSGRQFSRNYDWRKIVPAFNEIYLQLSR